MGLVKRKTRKKLSKQLTKIVKKHGADVALALATGIVSNLVADLDTRKAARAAKVPAVKVKHRPAVIVGSRRGQDASTGQAS